MHTLDRDLNRDLIRLLMQVVLSLALLAVGVFVLAAGQDTTMRLAACGWIGVVVGYWLR